MGSKCSTVRESTRNIYINRGSTDTDTGTYMRNISSVTAIEIPV
jgi:hypothetical protein